MASRRPVRRAAKGGKNRAGQRTATGAPRTAIGRRRRLRILDIAEREFTERGYLDASSNAIMRKSRRTVTRRTHCPSTSNRTGTSTPT
jgi:AcrR family transcriptional regulator